LSKKSKFQTELFTLLLLTLVFATLLILPQGMLPSSASPESTEYSISVSPTRIQEGFNTNITVSLQETNISTTYTFEVNVTSPNGVSYSSNVTVVTDGTGAGSNLTEFWSDFANANTDYVGIYRIAVNETLATSNFTVGLTDKLKYFRSETVNIRGSGYAPNETVIVDLKFDNSSVSTFPRSINASSGGVMISSWQIPADAKFGVYTLSISNATAGGTVKTPPDVQIFTVEGICEIQVRNLANQTVSGVTVEVWNATSGLYHNLWNETDETGWVKFMLSAGNYTFKAFWTHRGNDVQVGELNWTFTENVALLLEVWFSNLKLSITDVISAPIPFIDLSLKYNYTTRDNETIPETDTFTTNINGTVILQNVFTNISYLIEARRYGFLFNTTFIENMPAQGWNNITIIAPTYTMFVNVLDSKNAAAADLRLLAYDWNSSQIAQQGNTDERGNVTLSLTFGRYRLRFYKDDAFLKEVTADLLNQSLTQYFFAIRIDVYKVDLNVRVVDYFGQPIPNVLVVFQRKVDSNYKIVENETTASDGVASFHDIIGGDSRVSVSVAGRLGETRYLYVVDSMPPILFKLEGYVAVAGHALETSQFVTVVILLIIIVAFAIASTYKRLGSLLQRRRK